MCNTELAVVLGLVSGWLWYVTISCCILKTFAVESLPNNVTWLVHHCASVNVLLRWAETKCGFRFHFMKCKLKRCSCWGRLEGWQLWDRKLVLVRSRSCSERYLTALCLFCNRVVVEKSLNALCLVFFHFQPIKIKLILFMNVGAASVHECFCESWSVNADIPEPWEEPVRIPSPVTVRHLSFVKWKQMTHLLEMKLEIRFVLYDAWCLYHLFWEDLAVFCRPYRKSYL